MRGAKGMSCLDLTRSLEEALGGEIVGREFTPEAYESVQEEALEWKWQETGS